MMHRPEEPSLGYVNPSEQVTAPGDEDRYVCWLCGCARWEHDCPIAYRMQKGRNEPETWEGRPICQRCADDIRKRAKREVLEEMKRWALGRVLRDKDPDSPVENERVQFIEWADAKISALMQPEETEGSFEDGI